MLWGWGRKSAEAKRQRALEDAKDVAYAAWDAAIHAYNDARQRGDTRDQYRAHDDLKRALNERLRLGC